MSQALDRRLTTWAEIGAYIGRDPRTAKRYETERGLPVHRMPGAARSTVYAFPAELDGWLQCSGNALAQQTPGVAPSPPKDAGLLAGRHRRGRLAATVSGIAVLLAIGVAYVISSSQPARAKGPPPSARALYQKGVYDWNRRTPDGLKRATDAFTQAVVQDPRYAAAYVGLADCYNLAPEFGDMRPADAYPRARAAAERALTLDPSSAAAHRALAFVDFWWAENVGDALREFRTATRLDPRSAQTHHWYANALAALADPAAVTEINAAAALEPSSAIMADKGWILMMLRRYDQARDVLREVTRVDPVYAQAHVYLAQADDRLGDTGGMLSEMRRAAELTRNPDTLAMAAAAERGWTSGGRPAMLLAIARTGEALLASGQGDAFDVAAAEARLGRRDQTLAFLKRARSEHAPSLLSLAINPDFAWMKNDPGFRSFADRHGA